MLAYGTESYAYQTWHEDRGVTSALNREARASRILMQKLEQLARGEGVNDSGSNRSASPAHSTCLAVPHSPRCSLSQSHSQFKSPSLQCQQSVSQSSFAANIYSQVTQKESDQASGSQSGSKADTESQADGDSDSEAGEDSGGHGEGSGGKDAGSGKGVPEDGNSQQGGKIVEVSCHEAEESGSESGSSYSESKVEVKKAQPSKKTAEADPNTTLPKLDSKDSKEECKTNHYGFACHTDADFGTWHDKKISQGLKQWDERDKMTCDHMEPGKEAKCPDPLGTPLDYMESCRVFKSLKMSEYDLCCFYKVGLSGDFPEFPTPHEPATNNHMHSFLEKAHVCSRPNLLVVQSQDAVSGLSVSRTPHQCQPSMPKMETDAETGDKSKRKLSFCLFCQYLGSNDQSYLNHIICVQMQAMGVGSA